MRCVVEKFDHFGNGLSKCNEKIVFIKRVLPKEEILYNVKREKKHFIEAEVSEIISSSIDRIDSICPYYNECGGCNFLHATYALEKEFKKNKAKEILGNYNKFYETVDINYRNKVTLHVKGRNIGFYQEKTNDIIDISYCYLLNDKINNILERLNKYIKSTDHEINSIVIKSNDKEVLLDINGNIDENFLNAFFDVDTIINNDYIIKGSGYLIENIDKYKFQISSKSFFQVNKSGLLNIYEIIKKYLGNNHYKKALDLYSGIGTWGTLISDYVDKVICIELNKSSIKDAFANRELNNINNMEIINGKVEDFIDSFLNIDLVITDPPRSGLDKKTKEHLMKIKPKRIIYISCDMLTLKRDLDELNKMYDIIEINLVDMFKRTYHVETVVLLTLKDKILS